MNKLLSALLTLCLLANAASPAFAQPKPKPINKEVFNIFGGNISGPQKSNPHLLLFKDPSKLTFLEKLQLERMGIKLPKDIHMQKYNKMVEDFRHDRDLYALTPYQLLKAMDYESKTFTKLMQENPRYKAAVKKEKTIRYCGMALSVVAFAALAIACAPAAMAYGGAAASAYITGVTTVGVISTVSLYKAAAVVFMYEMFVFLGEATVSNLYADLTDRLIKYNLLNNADFAHQVAAQTAYGTISGSINIPQDSCPLNSGSKTKEIEIKPSSKWQNQFAHKEALIRYTGLKAINEYLLNEKGSAKYDLAMLDIINLFTDAEEVVFDEDVFTLTEIVDGKIKVTQKTNRVKVGSSRLIERTPDLLKALKTIQTEEFKKAKLPAATGKKASADIYLKHTGSRSPII